MTTCGSRAIMVKRMRAVLSGVLRCCSQSCRASMANPNRRENSDCEHFSFFLNALTSKSSGTCTTKPSVISPRAMARASLAAFMSLAPILDMTLRSLPVLPNYILERLADEALIRNSRPRRGGSHRVEQLPWQAHVDSLAFGLKLEPERSHVGQVVFGQVGLFNKLLGFLIAFEPWQFPFHNASFPSCACAGR